MKKILFLFTVSAILFISCKAKKEGIHPTIGNITESVYASGRVKTQNQYTVYSSVNGILNKINIKSGDQVAAGQVLFEIDNTTALLNAENSKLAQSLSAQNLGANSDKLQELEISIQAAQDKLKLDESIFQRQKNLWDQNIGSKIDFEQKKLVYENSKNNYELARSKYAQLKTQLQNDLKRANNNVAINVKQQNDFNVKSAISGKVYDILKEPGDLISSQMPLAIIGQDKHYIIELNISENDITKVKVGQLVIIDMDSYKGQTFEGVIDHIDPIMNERTRNFTVEAIFSKSPATLYPNLTLEANIIIQTKKNVITIPTEYINKDNSVTLKDDRRQAIKIGLSDYDNAEVIDGLSKDDLLFKP